MRWLVVLFVLGGGCISATARLHAGPTVSSDGQVDVQAGVAVGFGYALSEESAVTGSLGVSAGSRNAIDLTDTIEYVSVPEEGIGKRMGFTAQVPLVGEHVGMYVEGGAMLPVRRRRSSSGHEKSFTSTSTTVLAVGVRGRGGLMRQVDEELRFAAGGDVTLDWWMFSRWR